MSSGFGTNPVLEMMQRADEMARAFDGAHRQTLPIIQKLVDVLCAPSSMASGEDPTERVETQLSLLRTALGQMEVSVGEMMSMLYHVDLFLAAPTMQGVSGKDPKTALQHVSDLFHMYQSELLEKREALSDLSCEEIQPIEFAQRWTSMEQVHVGRKQTMDDLADLLAGWN